jgi:hypothetical protein
MVLSKSRQVAASGSFSFLARVCPSRLAAAVEAPLPAPFCRLLESAVLL